MQGLIMKRNKLMALDFFLTSNLMVSIDLRWVHWYIPTILVLGKMSQADNEFKINPGGEIVRPYHKN